MLVRLGVFEGENVSYLKAQPQDLILTASPASEATKE